MNIAFLGLGKFGQAIASLVEYNGYTYEYTKRSESRELSQLADIVFLTVPTQSIRHALDASKPFITQDTIIINCAKGIEEGSHLLVYQIVQSILGESVAYYTLLGPSFADDIIEHQPTIVSLGYDNEEHLTMIKEMLETPYFKIQPSRGYRSLELAGALKNLYAIASGYAQGIGFGMNTRARIFTIALEEFSTLSRAMGFNDYDVAAPGVAGDMMLTCNSEQSRNFKYGLRLAEGDHSLRENTIEGHYTSHSISYLAQECGVKMPLAELTSNIIAGNIQGSEAFSRFLSDN